ncbi:hypothetical protein ACJ41O_010478 [Fusarium nematophilum]
MADRKRIFYTYKTIEEWEKSDEEVTKIVQADTGVENWIANRALPPTAYPPPISTEAIEKIKKLSDDIVVEELQQED